MPPMHLEVERKLYTLATAALALATMVVLTVWVPLMSSATFVKLARVVGSGAAVAFAEETLRQLIAALVCVIPLKLTRHRLTVVDSLVLGCGAAFPSFVMIACEPPLWSLVPIATAPVLFMLVSWTLRNVRPYSWLDSFHSDQAPWLSIALAVLFTLQISLFLLLFTGTVSLLRPSVLMALAGAVLAILARRFDGVVLSAAAVAVFVENCSIYARSWPSILAILQRMFSCPEV